MKKQFLLAASPIDIEESRRILKNKFRNPNLVIEEVKQLQDEHEQKISEIRTVLNEFDSFGMKIKSIVFKPSQDALFGILTPEIIACIDHKKIKLWDMASNDRVATLKGHTNAIACLECIGDNLFASGSDDNTIKIWDSKNFVCLKTLIRYHEKGVSSLKNLTKNRIASGSSSSGDIKK